MRVKHVIFDLDGTLLDTTEGILESVRYTAKRYGFPTLSEKTLLKFIGPPIQQSFQTYYGVKREQVQEITDFFRAYYKSEALLKAVPYDRIYELCDFLKNRRINMSVATYKREDYMLKLLKHFHFDEYCGSMHGADNHNKLKKEDIIRRCVKESVSAKENTVMIGDTLNDALAAEKEGVSFIGVLYGFGFEELKDGSRFANIGVVEKPLQIADIVGKLS